MSKHHIPLTQQIVEESVPKNGIYKLCDNINMVKHFRTKNGIDLWRSGWRMQKDEYIKETLTMFHAEKITRSELVKILFPYADTYNTESNRLQPSIIADYHKSIEDNPKYQGIDKRKLAQVIKKNTSPQIFTKWLNNGIAPEIITVNPVESTDATYTTEPYRLLKHIKPTYKDRINEGQTFYIEAVPNNTTLYVRDLDGNLLFDIHEQHLSKLYTNSIIERVNP